MIAFATTTLSCPSSFQLKLALKCQNSPVVFERRRLRKLDRRGMNFLAVVFRNSAFNGNGVERRRLGNSWWVSSNLSTDNFSGWSNADGEEQHSGGLPPKQSIAGALGAGVAGVLLVAGLTVAVLSISKRSNSRVKQQMEPLPVQQEKLLSSGAHNDRVGKEKRTDQFEMQETTSQESKTASQAPPGKVLVPASVDQLHCQALAALQVLKVIEADVQPGDLCTRREYARWLVLASSALSRNTISKVYPAMYIDNVSELAFDDITPEDPDFPSIQGLAEAGLIASKLSRHDMQSSLDEDPTTLCFSPESPLSRQDLVSWKMSLEKRQLPEVDRKSLQQLSGFMDIDKIDPDAWPALVADFAAGEQGVITLAFGYTRLFQPGKPVTKAQAAIALATVDASAIISEELARIEAESMAEKAVAAHGALVAQVEKDLNASFEKELFLEREKINAVEKLVEEARSELERLRSEREEENLPLLKERAAIDSETEVLSSLRREVEEQLQTLMSNKLEISYEKEKLNKLQRDAETENQEIARLQYELEIERKALSVARAWAEDEAKRAREQAKALDQARDRWERQGIKIVIDSDLIVEADAGLPWLAAGEHFSVEGTIGRSENLVEKLVAMGDKVKGKSRDTINKIIQKVHVLILFLKEKISKIGRQAVDLKDAAKSKAFRSLQEMGKSSAEVTLGVKQVAGNWKEGVEKLSQKFKT
ncbi:S-layer-like proteiny domain [Abeliophyllum distichum]|uniref:S-layer-like proteiny domain n=1 Tax=Abeliophyllum distichum TaxID=126358 RepID=A0ABD1VXF3_9LAMI